MLTGQRWVVSLTGFLRATGRLAGWRDERGVALAMALLTLLVLTALIIGFATLATTEPTIANNQLLKRQVLGLAESGIEVGMWALNNPGDPQGIPSLAAIPAQYNSPLPHAAGATCLALGAGCFTITVAPVAGTINQAQITATGWIASIANYRSKAIITTTVSSWNGRFNLPGALTAMGETQFGGNAHADGTASTCGAKAGVFSFGQAFFSGASGASGSPPVAQNQPASAFAPFLLSPGEISALKSAARANGTYYQGNTGLNPIPNGVVFVDTVSGNPPSSSNVADLANVTVNGASSSGWLIVMGSVTIHGNVSYNGLVYTADLFTYQGTGNGGLSGGVVSHHISNPISSVVDTTDLGNSNISYNCGALQPPSGLSHNYYILPGTWKDLSG